MDMHEYIRKHYQKPITKLQLSYLLRKLADQEVQPSEPDWGLCSNLLYLNNYGYLPDKLCHQCLDLIQRWPKASGDKEYVISVTDAITPKAQYQASREDKWGESTYGSARRELCGWVGQQLRATDQ